MATYRKCEWEVNCLAERRVQSSYPDLAEAKVSLYLEFAHAPTDEHGEQQGNALSDRGTPILGKIKVISLADRVAGLADARITLDGDRWPELTDGRREALLDSLLCALEVLRDGTDKVKLDDCGRPKLKVRPAEIYVRGFYEVIDRHGEESLEAEALQIAWDKCVEQGLLTLKEVEPEPIPAGPRETLREYALRRGIDMSWRDRRDRP